MQSCIQVFDKHCPSTGEFRFEKNLALALLLIFLNQLNFFNQVRLFFSTKMQLRNSSRGEPGTRMPQPTSSNFSEGIPSEGQRFSLITLHQGHRRSVGGAGNFDRMTFGRIAGKTSFIHISRPHLKLTIALFYSSFQLSISSMQ